MVKIHLSMQETQETWVRSLGQEDSPGGGNGNSLQYSCLENSTDRGAWRATVHEVKSLSRVRLFATPWTVAHQAPPSMGFSRQEYWSYHFLLQGIFPTQGSNPGLLIADRYFYRLSHQGSPQSMGKWKVSHDWAHRHTHKGSSVVVALF